MKLIGRRVLVQTEIFHNALRDAIVRLYQRHAEFQPEGQSRASAAAVARSMELVLQSLEPDAVRPLLARYLAHLHGQSILADAGVTEAETAAIRAARAGGESGVGAVTDAHVDSFALAGTPDQVRGRLEAWRQAGLDTPILLPAGPADPAEQLAVIGAELGPCWRSLR